MTPGSPNALLISDALPSSQLTLLVGLSSLRASFKGGVLGPTPDILLPGLPLNSAGALTLPFELPDWLPSGIGIWTQAWIVDAGAIGGLAATNTLKLTTQPLPPPIMLVDQIGGGALTQGMWFAWTNDDWAFPRGEDWGQGGTAVTATTDGELVSIGVVECGVGFNAGECFDLDDLPGWWETSERKLHFWSDVASFMASPAEGDEVVFLGPPTNDDWQDSVGSYLVQDYCDDTDLTLTFHRFEFALSEFDIRVEAGQTFVVAVQPNSLGSRDYYTVFTSQPAVPGVYARMWLGTPFGPGYLSDLGAPSAGFAMELSVVPQ